ncbi:MAG: hypothetical protein EBT92_07470 [Planctomycetes bacterium]|nr:hypothetical protein [Planctomycetota bacterium]NBY03582.1 hypothetical protein [Planctomycetota bacterium]
MMIRIIMLFSLLLISGAMIAQEKEAVPTPEKSGDEGPVKLKKKKATPVESQEKPKDSAPPPVDKNKSEADPEKKKDKGTVSQKEMDPPKDNLEEEEIFGRIGKNLKDVDDRLGNLELGEMTLQKQRDILEDIDKLLKKNQSNESQSNQSQSKFSSKSESQNQNKQSKKSPDNQDSNSKDSDKGQDKQKQSVPKEGPQGVDSGKQQKQRPAGKSDSGGKPDAGNGQSKNMQTVGKGDKSPSEKSEVVDQGKSGDKNSKSGDGGKSDTSKDKLNPAADVFKEAWGHLPETLRAELNAYGVPNQFMDRYDEMIRKYYARVAEKGARKK